MVREETRLSFQEYFWKGVNLSGKVILDAGTGFGYTTLEIAERLSMFNQKGKIISVDIDSESFKNAKKLLKRAKLQDLVTFVEADLSYMPQIENGQVDIVISTATICAINSSPCRMTKALSEFYRVLKEGGQIVLSDECPLPKPRFTEEKVAVMRWQTIKALSDLIGEPHYNEVDPEDLEFTAKLVGFKDCRYAIFKGEKITKQRMNHFVKSATKLVKRLNDSKLKHAFQERIKTVKEIFRKEGGIFAPRYVFHAKK